MEKVLWLPLTSVCFARIYSLKVFIFFWSRKVFYWMERIFWLKIICKRNRILIHITLSCAPTYLTLPLLVSMHSDELEGLPCSLHQGVWEQQQHLSMCLVCIKDVLIGSLHKEISVWTVLFFFLKVFPLKIRHLTGKKPMCLHGRRNIVL